MGYYVPEALKNRQQWVVWRLETRPGSEKQQKIPYSPMRKQRNGQLYKASPTDARSWGSYADAVALYEHGCDYSGIGFVFAPGDGLVFIDVDNAIDLETGEYSEMAEEILQRFAGTYAEISQSEAGLHIACYGAIKAGFNNRSAGVEMYAQGRYMAFTGNALERVEPQPMQEAIDWLYDRYSGYTEAETVRRDCTRGYTTTEAETLERAMCSRSKEEFARLYKAGEWQTRYASQSEADLRLMSMLYFFSYGNEAITLYLFQQSALAKNLDRKQNKIDYLQRTLEAAKKSGGEISSKQIQRPRKHYQRRVRTGITDTPETGLRHLRAGRGK